MTIRVPLLLAAVLAATPQRPARAPDAGIPVRYTEGTVHGFLELRTAAGALLAPGDLVQIVRERHLESRMVFHFADSSVFEETVGFTQRGVFELVSYHLVQRGPAFSDDLDATITRAGAYTVVSRSHRSGETKRYTGQMDLPADTYNGLIITLAKNLTVRDTETVHIVAFTPKPRLIGLSLIPAARQHVNVGQHREPVINFTLKPRLGALLGFFARLTGKAPPDSHTWIVSDGAPAFVRYEGPLYAGPIWRIDLVAPGPPH